MASEYLARSVNGNPADSDGDVTVTGTSGTSGYSGYSGISGTNGGAGISGYSGYSGISGTNGGAGISGYSGYSGYSGISSAQQIISVYRSLGSELYAQTLGLSADRITAAVTPVFTNFYVVPVYLPTAQTLTGVKWFQATLGNYTATNENRIGLYTYSGGTLTLVASTASDNALWSTFASNTYGKKAFNGGTYGASAGLYFIGILYNRSAVSVAPQLGACAAFQTGVSAMDFSNNAKLYAQITAQATLPTPIGMNTMTSSVNAFWLALY